MVPRILAGRFSCAEKIRRRSKIHLDDAGLTPKTQVRYYAALRLLLPYFERCQDERDLDFWISKWIRVMWRTGEPLLVVGDGLSALHYYQPWTKRKVPHSWKLFSTWRRVEIPARAPPLVWSLVSSMAAFEIYHNHWEMATLLLLGFHCLLRTGEMLQLTAADFALGIKTGICALKATKSGKRNCTDKAISITHPLVLEMVSQFVKLRRQIGQLDLPIWTGTGSAFRNRFRFLCEEFAVGHHQFRPYSLRRGGATALFQNTNSMEAALIRGRWESSRVARLYIADGLSFLPQIRLSPKTRAMLRKYSL